LRLWQRNGASLTPVAPDHDGRLWSNVLQRYLVSDDAWLRLVDRHGNRCLTSDESERQAREAERYAKEAERYAKEAERRAKELAWAKLRELGIDPTTLE
jgi:hypothetical protein